MGDVERMRGGGDDWQKKGGQKEGVGMQVFWVEVEVEDEDEDEDEEGDF
jgi:hypothetical protein